MQSGPTLPISSVSAWTALAILSLLGTFTVLDLFDGPGTERQERVAKTPALPTHLTAVKAFPGDARFHVKNRYALKEHFITLNTILKAGLLGHSPTPDVLIGQGGFLFLNHDGAVALAQGKALPHRGHAQAWQQHFHRMAAGSHDQQIPFLFALAPNKHSVYPDRLPDWITAPRLHDNATDQVLALAQMILEPAPVDLRAVLAKQRTVHSEMLLYHRSDTHWNELGAALAVQAVLATVSIPFDVPPVSVTPVGMGGDLARMTGQQHRLDEQAPLLPRPLGMRCKMPDGSPFAIMTLDPLPRRSFTCSMQDAPAGRILVFMDSFGAAAVPALAHAFQESHFVWQDTIDLSLVDRLAPDLVLQILVERKVWEIDPGDAQQVGTR